MNGDAEKIDETKTVVTSNGDAGHDNKVPVL
jgi:hypothetical protein